MSERTKDDIVLSRIINPIADVAESRQTSMTRAGVVRSSLTLGIKVPVAFDSKAITMAIPAAKKFVHIYNKFKPCQFCTDIMMLERHHNNSASPFDPIQGILVQTDQKTWDFYQILSPELWIPIHQRIERRSKRWFQSRRFRMSRCHWILKCVLMCVEVGRTSTCHICKGKNTTTFNLFSPEKSKQLKARQSTLTPRQ